MTRDGFRAAVAASPVQYRNSDDWITYFILYQCLSQHASPTAYVPTGITVLPDEPGGGLFGGAGASGKWEDAPPQAGSSGGLAVAAGVLGVLAAPDEPRTDRSEPLPAETESKYQPGDTVGGYGGAAPERDDPPPAEQPDPPAAPEPDPPAQSDPPSSGGGD
jgi:hypothetical protein